jgi:hypothetical protein
MANGERNKETGFLPNAIYFDTEPLRGAGWPHASRRMQQLAQVAKEKGIRLCIPTPVERELEQQFVREFDRIRSKSNDANKALTRFGFVASPIPDEPEMLARYRDVVERYKKELGLSSVACTERSIQQFYEDAVNRSAPFGVDKDTGIKDAVILHSVLDDLQKTTGSLAYFVSADQDHGTSETYVDDKTLLLYRDLDTVIAALTADGKIVRPIISRWYAESTRFRFDLVTRDMLLSARGGELGAVSVFSNCRPCKEGRFIALNAGVSGSWMGVGVARVGREHWPRVFYSGQMTFTTNPIPLHEGENLADFECRATLQVHSVSPFVRSDKLLFSVEVSGRGKAKARATSNRNVIQDSADLLLFGRTMEYVFDHVEMQRK